MPNLRSLSQPFGGSKPPSNLLPGSLLGGPAVPSIAFRRFCVLASLLVCALSAALRDGTDQVTRLFHITRAIETHRKLLTTAAVFLSGLLLAHFAAQLVLENNLTALAMIVMGFVGLAVAVRILNNWRQGLYIFFGWLFVEDFVRKYLGNNMAIYFAKDILVVLVYISFFAARRKRRERRLFQPPFRTPLLLLVWFAVAQVFNPGSTSVFYGFLGLKLYFLYVPLIYLGYALIDSELELRRFFMFNALLLLVVGGLGIAQAIIGPTFLNPGELQEDIRGVSTLYRISPVTGLSAYRPTSVFVSSGRFQNLIIEISAIHVCKTRVMQHDGGPRRLKFIVVIKRIANC